MNLPMIGYIVGLILEIEAGFLLLPGLVGLGYGESTAWAFFATASGAALLGAIPLIRKPKNRALYAREGLTATALSWVVMSVVGALPFVITGQIPGFVDALFEIVSGFTTTGSSILTRVEDLDKGMIFWRSLTHWVGGMGVLVFMLAILPLVGGQNMQLMRAESPGPSVDKLVPKLRGSALWLYSIYFAMTVVCFLLLWSGGMTAFDAACITFGTAGTGGFGIVSASCGDYNAFCQVVITVFMMLFGTNFNFFYFLALRKIKAAVKMEEVFWYYFVFFFAALTIIWDLHSAGMLGTEAGALDSFFSVASVMTTTGYATKDFNLWPTYSRVILVAIMFSGACAGSTGGGIKISRFIIYWKSVTREIRRMAHPRSVRHVRLDGKRISDSVLQNTYVYLAVYVFLYVFSTLIVALDGMDFTTTFTAVAATINNIGPGLNVVGPAGNFSEFSNLSKLVMTFDMLAGRLEIFPLLILFLPSTWRKHD